MSQVQVSKPKIAKSKTKTKAKVSKPYFTWRVEYWTDGPARIGCDYFKSLADMFEVIDPKHCINSKIDLASVPCKRIEVTIIGNTGKRINNQICSAHNVVIAAVGAIANKVQLFSFYEDQAIAKALVPFMKEMEKHKQSFKKLFKFNQMVTLS
jgi:hypothetical protein